MNFNLNLKAYLKSLPLADMSGHQKFLAVAALNSRGKANAELATREIRKQWRKSQLGLDYNPVFYDRAQQEGWVDPVPEKTGILVATQAGLDHLSALVKLDHELTSGELKKAGGLVVVNRKATHTFDKYLRKIFADAKSEVLVADAWVDETIFDTVLDVIPKSIPIRLLYAQARGGFAARAARFSTQYPQFAFRRYKPLHDRFVVVDDAGYVLGPSIKDAATNSPALVVELDLNEKRLLRSFFDELWTKSKKTPQNPA
jgi:hypothetical protein